MKVFNMDHAIYQNILKSVQFFYLSILVIIFSLPVFTIGTSFSAGYYVYHKFFLMKDGNSVFLLFWKSFKENLKGTLFVSNISIVLMIVLYMNYQAAEKGLFYFVEIKYIFMLLIVLLATYLLLYLCLAARFENSVPKLLISTLSSALLYLSNTLILLILLVISYFLITIIPITFLIVPGSLIALSYATCERIFKLYM